jgi:hypothetical protein
MPPEEKPKKPPGASAKPVTAARPALKNPGGAQDYAGDDEVTVVSTIGELPKPTVAAPKAPVVSKPPVVVPRPTIYPEGLTKVQKRHMDSGYLDGVKERKREASLGAHTGRFTLDDLQKVEPERTFTGDIAAPQVSDKSGWKAVVAPIQSRPGQRSKQKLEQVLKQFAVTSNPRYRHTPPEKSKAHIFVWDVSIAMGCEIPHFVGANELTLNQTIDWVRFEAPMKGWVRTGEFDVYDLANAGRMVIALPKDAKVRAIAIAVPEEPAEDGKPLLVSACGDVGYALHPLKCLGIQSVEYFHHS